jgi:glycosyltransferase involved in cell wall biosynthesis
MKLLWVKADFLHPTVGGKQIRTLETLKPLHRRHEIHYLALHDGNPEAIARSSEYCTRAYAVPHKAPEKNTVAFAGQLVKGLVSPLPVAVERYRSEIMKRQVEDLSRREKFDCIVCDFLFPAPNMPDLSSCVLFQHNVESTIWKRHVQHAATPLHRWYFRLQERRMAAYEGEVCRSVKSIIAVSETDAEIMKRDYGARRVAAVPTGVDVEYFTPVETTAPSGDLVFVGAMDWMPNIDGAQWFVNEILPFIRKRLPECTLTLAGRKPVPALLDLGRKDPRIRVTGTVPDIRPYLWNAKVCIVPLRIGGGTRLKIFESMAARVPVVSTTVGAEGLPVENGNTIYLADDPQTFAARCLELLESKPAAQKLAAEAWDMVSSRFSWEAVSREFERLLC